MFLVKPDATSQEIEGAIKDGTGDVFAREMQISGQDYKAREMLKNIWQQHEEIMRVEKSIYVSCHKLKFFV